MCWCLTLCGRWYLFWCPPYKAQHVMYIVICAGDVKKQSGCVCEPVVASACLVYTHTLCSVLL